MSKTAKKIIPEVQDQVKHISGEMTGTVIARFTEGRPIAVKLDVRGDDGRIYYNTPAENWERVRTEEETWN